MSHAADIYIIDHNSTEPESLAALDHIRSQGAHVVAGTRPFKYKHAMLSDLMRTVQRTYRLLIPLDIDEHLAHFDPDSDTLRTDRDGIRGLLEDAAGKMRDGRFGKFESYQYVADDCDHSKKELLRLDAKIKAPRAWAPTRHRFLYHGLSSKAALARAKTFYINTTFVGSDQGNHFGISTNPRCLGRRSTQQILEVFDECFVPTRLALLHFNVLSFGHWKHKMVARAKSYGFTHTSSCTREGAHYCGAYKAIWRASKSKKFNKDLVKEYLSLCPSSARYIDLAGALQLADGCLSSASRNSSVADSGTAGPPGPRPKKTKGVVGTAETPAMTPALQNRTITVD